MSIDPADPHQYTRLANQPGPPNPATVARLRADLAAARDPRDPDARDPRARALPLWRPPVHRRRCELTCLTCGATTPEAGGAPPLVQLALWEEPANA